MNLGSLGTRKAVRERDVFRLQSDPDGVVRQPCWFCNAQMEFRPSAGTGDTAVVMIEVLGTSEHMHGICHTACAERARGSLAF